MRHINHPDDMKRILHRHQCLSDIGPIRKMYTMTEKTQLNNFLSKLT